MANLPNPLDRMWGNDHSNASKKYNFDPGPPSFTWAKSITFPLYRYSASKRIDDLFRTGQIWLSPLLQFRDTVAFNQAQADATEGQIELAYFDSDAGMPVVAHVLAQNQWTICCSEVRDDDFMCNAFEADSCFEISSLEFFLAINRKMAPFSNACLMDKIVYLPEERERIWPKDGDTIFAGCFKRSKHARQREVRPMWEPKDPPLSSGLHHDLREDQCSAHAKRYLANEHKRCQGMLIDCPDALRYARKVF